MDTFENIDPIQRHSAMGSVKTNVSGSVLKKTHEEMQLNVWPNNFRPTSSTELPPEQDMGSVNDQQVKSSHSTANFANAENSRRINSNISLGEELNTSSM